MDNNVFNFDRSRLCGKPKNTNLEINFMHNLGKEHIVGQHENYWSYRMARAEERLEKLFKDNGITIGSIFGNDEKTTIDSIEEAEHVLSFVIDHAAAPWEKALAITCVTTWIQSYNQIVKTDFYM